MVDKKQQKLQEEYEKYKDVKLSTSEIYTQKPLLTEKVILKKIDKRKGIITIKNISTGTEQTKDMHWCRKNLQVIDYDSESKSIDDWLAAILKEAEN